MDTSFKEISVTIKSKDKKVNQKLLRIEKLSLFQYWISKALPLLENYKTTLYSLDNEKDPQVAGVKVQHIECYLMTSISLFIRCFLDQNGTKLQITNITNDQRLIQTYNLIKNIRDHEYVHWKGERSKIKINYNFILTEASMQPKVPNFNIEYNENEELKEEDKLNIDEIKNLYKETLSYIEKDRNKTYIDMLNIFQNDEIRSKSSLLDNNGESIFKKK